ncbi:MAG: hypothetical protein QM820_28075 [Minicystis sp.]
MIAGRFVLAAAAAVTLVACAGGTETLATGGSSSSATSSGASSGAGGSSSSASAGSGGGGGGSTASSSSSSGAGTGGSGGMGTGGSGGGVPCHWSISSSTCGPGMYCNAPGCGDGTCAPLGTSEMPDRAPACGCDGVSYWNASIAASHGMAIQASGVCMPQKTCGGFANEKCPAGATCTVHVQSAASCGSADLGGTCWAVPATCMAGVGFGPQTRACGAATCAGECDLIKGGQPWYDDNTCPQ